MPADERVFPFLNLNTRAAKPRARGLTEIRGPYYTPTGTHYLQDLFEAYGSAIDIFKFSGGSFALLPRSVLRELIELCHRFEVKVSTGGFLERVLTIGPEAVRLYLDECKALQFDIVEISSGYLSIPNEALVQITRESLERGLTPKPEVGIQFGAGGASDPKDLERLGTKDPRAMIELAQRHLDAGAKFIMIESEGITEQVTSWRTDVAQAVVSAVGLEHLMFEAAEPEVFGWYIKQFGPEVNLFVDHSQIVQLECLRAGLWGTADLWGRVVTYPTAST